MKALEVVTLRKQTAKNRITTKVKEKVLGAMTLSILELFSPLSEIYILECIISIYVYVVVRRLEKDVG